MENRLLARKSNGKKILFSELLANPPSDEALSELVPNEAVWCPED